MFVQHIPEDFYINEFYVHSKTSSCNLACALMTVIDYWGFLFNCTIFWFSCFNDVKLLLMFCIAWVGLQCVIVSFLVKVTFFLVGLFCHNDFVHNMVDKLGYLQRLH